MPRIPRSPPRNDVRVEPGGLPVARPDAPAVGNAQPPPLQGARALPTQAWIDRFFSPQQDPVSGLVRFEWSKPGDTISFEMSCWVSGDPGRVKAQVWTNANNNSEHDQYYAVDMRPVSSRDEGNGKRIVYRADIPISKIGNYRATGRVATPEGEVTQWAGDRNISDVRFRPRDEAFDKLNMVEVNVGNANFDPATGQMGTFADLMEAGSPDSNGKYTLEWLKRQGHNAIWLMPPFEISQWEYRHPADTAGSPYAAKDFFSVRTEFSRSARGLNGEGAREAAMNEFRAFVDQAHDMGIKVLIDIPLNHVGHNYKFRDLFVTYNQAGEELREVRTNDFSQLTTNPEQERIVQAALQDPNIPDFFQYIMPWMFASRSQDPRGAQNVNDIAPGGHTEWFDTAQLYHGRLRAGRIGQPEYHWWDRNPSQEERNMQAWLGRVMQFWTIDMKCDGFRIDHLTGLPLAMLEQQANLLQGMVDERSPGKVVYLMGEDFNTPDATRPWVDNLQGGFFHAFTAARNQEGFRAAIENPWFKHILNLDSHDEHRFVSAFGGSNPDFRAAGRQSALLMLLGGPVMTVVGGEFGETERLPFKAYQGVPSVRARSRAQSDLAALLGKVGKLREEEPALHDDNRGWLQPNDGGGYEPDLVAFSRFADNRAEPPIITVANMNNGAVRERRYALDDELRQRIDPNARYQLLNLLEEGQATWPQARTGADILRDGIFVRLDPYEIQLLKLRAV